jgi:hypothetical protein
MQTDGSAKILTDKWQALLVAAQLEVSIKRHEFVASHLNVYGTQ